MPASRPGRRRWWRATRSGRISPTTAPSSSRISRRSPATANSARTRRSSAASAASAVSRSASSARRRAPRPRARIRHNFGMARPEGYRKAVAPDGACRPLRACRCCRFVDTAGAYPGIEAEERGQAEAIARSTEACLALGVAERRRGHRRGRLGRRHRDRHREQGADARARDLQRDLARGRRLDPVARLRAAPRMPPPT